MTTTPTLALADLAENGPDVDMLRQMVQFMAQRLMKIDVDGRCGAGLSTSGQREVLGLKVRASEAEPFWTEFLQSLNRRGLRGVKLVISDGHEGIRAAASKVLKATWQRCRVHFMRNAPTFANRTQR